MALTFNILPDGTTAIGPPANQWLEPNEPGPCAGGHVDTDNGDTQYCYESTHDHIVTFTIADPGVAEEDIGNIISVKVKLKAKHTETGAGTSYVDVYQTGTGINNGYTRVGVTDTSSYGLYATDAKTAPFPDIVPVSGWTYTNLQNIQIKLVKFRNPRTGQLRISYLYVEVTYSSPSSPTKMLIPSGKLTLNGGSFIIK